MFLRSDKKTVIILSGIIICLLMAIIFGLHLLWPALDPITSDMVKIFSCGAASGLLGGIWLGIKMEKEYNKIK